MASLMKGGWTAGTIASGILFAIAGAMAGSETMPPWQTPRSDAEAYRQPMAGLSADQLRVYSDGARAFRTEWRTSESSDGPWGLGPLANAESCVECREANGRSAVLLEPFRLRNMVVRLSVSEDDGEARPHPVYGAQFNDVGLLGTPPEGIVRITYAERPVTLADGSRVDLREPMVQFRSLAYGPLQGDVVLSLRAAPPLIGMGLLEAVPESALLAMATQQPHLGLAGRVARSQDRARGVSAPGRFGRRAGQPTIAQQVAAAFQDDLGVTSKLYPESTCTPSQEKCRKADALRMMDPELAGSMLADITAYLRMSAVPAPRSQSSAAVLRGATLFTGAGCAACHQPTLHTGDDAAIPALRNIEFHPFTDLLLHDMGEELADRRIDGSSAERAWRTSPLWGLGLIDAVNHDAGLLHDGRARSITEAILWHGGEARKARDAFVTMNADDRKALLDFVGSI